MVEGWRRLILCVGAAGLIAAGCDAPSSEAGRTQRALTTEEGRWDEARRLQSLATSRYQDYLARLSRDEREAEENVTREARVSGGNVFIQWSRRGTAKTISGHRMQIPVDVPSDVGAAERAQAFLSDHAALFGLANPTDSLMVHNAKRAAARTIVRFKQSLMSLPVFSGGLVVHIGRQGDVEWVAGHVVPEAAVSTPASTISAEEASAVVDGDPSTAVQGWFDPEAFSDGGSEPVRLAWRIRAGTGIEQAHVYVDAETGRELGRVPLVLADQHVETFYSDPGGSWPPGDLQYDDVCHTSGDATCPAGWCSGGVCQTSSWTGTAEQVRDSTMAAYDYYDTRHGRDSWDDGQCGTSGHPCTDAGLHRMRAASDWGNCTGRWFNYDDSDPAVRATVRVGSEKAGIDVVTHEFTHGVAWSTVPYPFASGGSVQGGALGEGFPDIFGELTQHFSTGSSDWRTATGSTTCVQRSLADPPSVTSRCTTGVDRPFPDHWQRYSTMDCNVVHWSATIPGKCGYMLGREPTAGSETHWGVSVTGVGEQDASWLLYDIMVHYLDSADFTQFREAMYNSCPQWFGTGSDYLDCIHSVDAIGLWSADLPRWDVDGVTSISYHPVGSEDRRWLFYKKVGADRLAYRYRSCPVYDTSCQWSAETEIDNTIEGPASTTFGGYLLVCFTNTSNGIWCDKFDSSGSFSITPDPNGSVSGSPALAAFDGLLYVAYRRSDGAVAWKTLSSPTGSWSAENLAGFDSVSAPTLASTDEDPYGSGSHLWIVYNRTGDERLVYREFTGTGWGPELLAGRSDEDDITASYRTSARMYRGRLNVATRDGVWDATDTWVTGPFHMSCQMPCDSRDDWTRWVLQDGDAIGGDINLDAYGSRDGRLYLWHADPSSDTLQWRYKNSK